ncbi:GmrSD restriction endonuclease domain-containing protein [Nitrosomonas ureae]|uniref:Uncharacterized conserved protein, contains ParB-like and HNH nuclease domains n=1 Tax=Nitrosomonas ureae TaxID=44577 RepID=A0A1H2HGP4_9PROT|nr:DUF262 domain-containing protein [Nitrosomonas ureae]ALQ51648.1 hypothetical protein ATY38_10710 [Nitrosomonas ureae]SDU31061.1 Uncharacterized conserved protein, contains ParB-like and HNH nuclease domains [Nitrosomonas ureae]
MTNLDHQVEGKRKEIHTDAYPMSIGEIINLYLDGELDIHPEFQRIYRWNLIQKSRLIESLLLGIPLPSFFVAQREDGVWDVVDGLQRLSTIFSFLGIYKNDAGDIESPLRLTGTEYLPSLEGKCWSEDFDDSNHLSKELQRAFKREKIDLKIIKKESDEYTKYELFQRLNTFGSSLSDQEVRNCLLIMINKEMYSWLSDLANNDHFINVFPLTTKQIDEQYHLELVLRFLALKDVDVARVKGGIDIGEFLTKRMKELATDTSYNMPTEGRKLLKTFKILDLTLGENAFKKFQDGKYTGAFSLSIFEVIGLGLGFNIDSYDENNTIHLDKIREVSKSLLSNSNFEKNSGSGARASSRLPHILPMGRDLLRI